MTGCPGLTRRQTEYGRTVQIDQSTCVNDQACQRITVCPAFEQVTVVRYQAPRRTPERGVLAGLPEPPRPLHAEQETWRCFIPGVGGMGVGVATSILAAAGNAMGYRVQFARDKGTALRTGSTCSQLVYTHNGYDNDNAAITASIPYGSCDLMLGLDLHEAVAGLDPDRPYRVAAADRTAVVVNAVAAPTVSNLMGLVDDVDADDLERTLRRHSHPDRYCSFDLAELSQQRFGSKRYVNVMLLGMACQLGLLPLRRQVLEQALATVLPEDSAQNLRAFAVGRAVVVKPQQLAPPVRAAQTPRATYRRTSDDLQRRINRRRGRARARQFRRLIRQTRRRMGPAGLDLELMQVVIAAVRDCFVWGGADYAQRYCRQVVGVALRDEPARGLQLTKAVARNLAQVMLVKDEVYVSALLTSPEKLRRDRQRFNVDLEAGDQIAYRWPHRPEFDLFGRRFRFEWTSRLWQLRLIARLRWLRRLIPRWHRREREFRQWYERLIGQLDFESGQSEQAYQRWVAILRMPETVCGFREVAYPKMLAARRQAEEWLSTDPDQFEPPAVVPADAEPASAAVHSRR